MESNQPIHQITRKSGSNLALSFVSLPQEKKDAMSVFYAFCRLVDDISDDKTRPAATKQAELNQWREEIRACYKGTPATPHGRELQHIIRTYLIPPKPLLDIIDGVEMDLTRSRYGTFAELGEYCYRVASAVGLVSIEIFGYTKPVAQDYAVALGMAFQLTNILRDVRYDLVTYGRVYLPKTELDAFGVTEEDLLSTAPHAGRTKLYRLQYYRAQHYFHKAARLLHPGDRKSFIAAELMTEVYHRLLEKIRAAGFPNPEKPIRLNHLQKILAVHYARKHGAEVNRPGLAAPQAATVWGAGFAGLNAALQAGLRGHIPRVLEAKSYAGGRAHSFTDAKSGTTLDNGQHIFMGCYPSCLELFDLLGVGDKLDRQDAIEVPYVSPTETPSSRPPPAPPPSTCSLHCGISRNSATATGSPSSGSEPASVSGVPPTRMKRSPPGWNGLARLPAPSAPSGNRSASPPSMNPSPRRQPRFLKLCCAVPSSAGVPLPAFTSAVSG